VTDTLLAYLRLAALTGPDAFLLEALFRRDVWGHLQNPISQENEEGLCRTMIEGCSGALASVRYIPRGGHAATAAGAECRGAHGSGGAKSGRGAC